MPYRVVSLDETGWPLLEAILRHEQANSRITDTILQHLRDLGAVSFLLEEDYIDRDFSEAYSAYYAKTFRRHSKLCKRILVFGTDISFLTAIDDVKQAAIQLEAQDFLGQIVLRPVMQAPINGVILRAPPVPAPYEAHLLVKGRYSAHVLGAELLVEGIPMTQQDSRVGACAQATIWVAARHFHTRHRGPWLSTVSITQSAIVNSEHGLNQVLPAGSEFLSLTNMVAALRSAGQEPLVYAAPEFNNQTGMPVWSAALRPADIINRYVDSGIPVILGLKFSNQPIGHAIILTGQILNDAPAAPLPLRPSRGIFCEAFYANDDQIGPNIKVPVNGISPIGQTPYNIAENTMYLMIPLPNKVYLPAEKAEAISWNLLGNYSAEWANLKAHFAGKLGASEQLGDDFTNDAARNEVIARTYLTYGWKYKHRSIRNNFPNKMREIVRSVDLPRFVYVTEFSTVSSTANKTKYDRRIFAHSGIDATAKHHGIDSVLLFHAPGYCLWHSHDDRGHFKRFVIPIEDSEPYYPKSRGEMDFTNFQPAIP